MKFYTLNLLTDDDQVSLWFNTRDEAQAYREQNVKDARPWFIDRHEVPGRRAALLIWLNKNEV